MHSVRYTLSRSLGCYVRPKHRYTRNIIVLTMCDHEYASKLGVEATLQRKYQKKWKNRTMDKEDKDISKLAQSHLTISCPFCQDASSVGISKLKLHLEQNHPEVDNVTERLSKLTHELPRCKCRLCGVKFPGCYDLAQSHLSKVHNK